MKSLIIRLSCLGAILAPTIAVADGIPDYAETPAIVAGSWTGLYAGINAGYAWTGTIDWQYNVGGNRPGPFDNDGAFGGLHVGYQQQWGNIVGGIEASIDVSHDMNGSNSCPNPAFTCSTEINHFGTVVGRLGFTGGKWLLYGQAGYAFASVHDEAVAGAFRETSTERHDGWAYGGGVEYMLCSNVFAGVDYLHLDLGDELHPGTQSPGIGTVPRNIDLDADIVRARLSFKFGAEPSAPLK